MRLTLTVKTVYGKPLYYPACPASQAITTINKSKTLNKANLQLLQDAGFELDIRPDAGLISLAQ